MKGSLATTLALTALTLVVLFFALREIGLPSILIGAGLGFCSYQAILAWRSLFLVK